MVDEQVTVGKKKQDRLIGTTVADRYEILSIVGHGATTSVYKAQDKHRSRLVVIKMLHTHSIANEITVRRFDQECKTLALLKHPNIVAHYDSGVTEQDQPFLVMEFLDGVTLKQMLEEKGSLDISDALPLFIEACAGLAAAHEKDVVHRDMKPANVMVVKDRNGVSRVKILDFGVAKLLIQGETFQTKTQTGEMLGTLLYMSPEQCLDQDLDGRADVYALGCVLYEVLTGKPPLCGRTAFETMNKHLSEKPAKMSSARPDLVFPLRLENILRKAMEKDPSQRFQTISKFGEQLQSYLSEPHAKSPVLAPIPFVPEVRHAPSPVPQSEPDPSVWGEQNEPDYSLADAPEIPEPLAEDMSREGTINFLASESMDGVPWRRIYADAIKLYAIKENEVLQEQKRIASRQYNLIEMEKFALARFNSLDQNQDGFVTKEELKAALMAGRFVWREEEFIKFLLQHLVDIRLADSSKGMPTWPKSPTGFSIKDIQEYFRQFDTQAAEANSARLIHP